MAGIILMLGELLFLAGLLRQMVKFGTLTQLQLITLPLLARGPFQASLITLMRLMEWQRIPGSTRLMILGLGRQEMALCTQVGSTCQMASGSTLMLTTAITLPLVLWLTETRSTTLIRIVVWFTAVGSILLMEIGSGLMTTVLFTLAGSTCLTASGSTLMRMLSIHWWRLDLLSQLAAHTTLMPIAAWRLMTG